MTKHRWVFAELAALRNLREFGRRLRELDPQIVAEINRYKAEFNCFVQFSGEEDES